MSHSWGPNGACLNCSMTRQSAYYRAFPDGVRPCKAKAKEGRDLRCWPCFRGNHAKHIAAVCEGCADCNIKENQVRRNEP